MEHPLKVRFGDCSLDGGARRLLRGGRETHLSPKAFDLLLFLIENRPRAIAKRELLERIWPGVFVSEGSLTRAINEIRDAVGDPARGSHIVRTVHGYGYAFEGEILDEERSDAGRPASAVCWLTWGKLEFALPEGEHIIGRDADAAVRLESPKVSRRHARIVARQTGTTIEDLGSKNGTFVRGVRIEGAAILGPGDTVGVGPFVLTFAEAGASQSTETQHLSSRG